MLWTTGMKGTGPLHRTVPVPSVTLTDRGVAVADQVDADAVDDERVVNPQRVVTYRCAGLGLVAQAGVVGQRLILLGSGGDVLRAEIQQVDRKRLEVARAD